jgi:cytochrome c5
MKLAGAVALILFTSSVGLCVAATGDGHGQGRDHAKSTGQAQADRQAARGEQVFKENCSRCHDAPEALRPQITVQIIRHMRVRASLSAEDEKALLHFMNRE